MAHMQDFPLLLSTLYDHAVWIHPDQEIVSVESDRSLTRTTYAETDARVRKLASAFDALGIEPGGAVGTFAWNNIRHHELYWATANTGRICHTINIRLFADQIVYVANHARDQAMFVDPDLVPLMAPLASQMETVKHWVIMGPEASDELPGSIAYDDLIADQPEHGHWPLLDERSPMMLCYSSGTTGHPKGVAYTQRSTYLHTVTNLANFPIEPTDNVLPVVPMFHAAAWGYPYMSVTRGAKLTYPGPDLSPQGLVNLFANEEVTFSAGVPTVWLGVKQYLEANPDASLSTIRAFLCGGSAVPRAMIEWFWKTQGIRVVQGWGMTETNPVASVAILKPHMEDWPLEEQLDRLETAGIPVPGLQVKIVDEVGEELPHDGEAFGELLIRGPWIAGEYYKDDRTPQSFVDGWLRTGDVCKITPEGYIRITDRAKDVIKSGGEWISSLDLENELMAHPAVAEATVVGLKHPKWQERPVAFVVKSGEVTQEELIAHLEKRVASWWLPDKVVFVDAIPKTGTGKFDKKVVRDQYSDLLMG
ncbi:MAG: long-chain fatty acid--CoA ligase [Acidimicrobiales bacterium]|jgi:fatty-acyl-CoA synthase|nr:long-chain fatty acid--CoA ligase [Acidimicrobiales bacterium]HLV90491.1 long-chain fatty acid--CoA ligase [Acidimicrobiia bacterium]